jgi:hypothetical protein
MDTLEEKVSKLLQHRFGRMAKVELDEDADGIIGTVTSTKFRGVEMIDRMNMIWDTLEASLNSEEQKRIVIIGPRTPEETRED